MNRYVMEEFHRLPDLHERLARAARRERARAIGAAFTWLLGRPAWLLGVAKKRLTPRMRPARWLARLG